MFGRRLFHFLFTLLLIAGFVLVYLYLMPLDAMQYISLLFTTIALTLVYTVPIVYPKRGKGYAAMTFRLYGVTGLYALIVIPVAYLFSFKYVLDDSNTLFGLVLDEKFYFLAHTVVLGLFMMIILLCMGTPKKKEPYYDEDADDDEEEEDEPVKKALLKEKTDAPKETKEEEKLPATEPLFKFKEEEPEIPHENQDKPISL